MTQRNIVLILVSVSCLACLVVAGLPPIPQDPGYHQFADQRPCWEVENCFNVLSNLPFVVLGGLGLCWFSQIPDANRKIFYGLFCVAVILTGLGSSYYHLLPNNERLVWDRLPMTIAFMSFFCYVLALAFGDTLARRVLFPCIFSGLLSVGYWCLGEWQGRGDLRPYILVQFLPMVLMVIILCGQVTSDGRAMAKCFRYIWLALFFYVLAKITEVLDQWLWGQLVWISGHSIKHLLSAVAVAWALRAFFYKGPEAS